MHLAIKIALFVIGVILGWKLGGEIVDRENKKKKDK